jgi:hypothetical protein
MGLADPIWKATGLNYVLNSARHLIELPAAAIRIKSVEG